MVSKPEFKKIIGMEVDYPSDEEHIGGVSQGGTDAVQLSKTALISFVIAAIELKLITLEDITNRITL